jgi:hypothetical protein
VSDAEPGLPELVVGAWRGYRVWRISGDQLTGWWHTGYVWAPGSSEASCDARRWTLRGRRARHPGLAAPERDCRCGLYALEEPWDFAGYLPSRHFGVSSETNAVIGVVAGWGRAFRGEYGWRHNSPSRWPCIGPRTLTASRWTESPAATAARSSRGEASCSASLTSAPEVPRSPSGPGLGSELDYRGCPWTAR